MPSEEMTSAPVVANGSPFSAPNALVSWMQEIAPYGVFTTDSEFRIQSWNHWFVTHSGVAADQVIGKNLLALFPDLVTRRLDERFRRALTGEVSMLSAALHRYLIPLPPPSHQIEVPHMLQTVRIAPLPSGDAIVGTIVIVEDVTERELQALALQRQGEHDRMLSAALGVLLQSANPTRDVSELFPSIAPSLGIEAYFYHVLDPSGTSLNLHAAGGLAPKLKESLSSIPRDEGPCGACARTRQRVVVSQLQTNTVPTYADLKATGLQLFACFPLAIGDHVLGTMSVGSYTRESFSSVELKFLSTLSQYIAIAMDRSRRDAQLQAAQESLREHAENLESKVAERTARLHDSIAQLESFSYTVAHDLRAPIRSLKGYAEVLAEDYADVLPAEGHVIVARLQRASNRLDALTRDLLRFSKIARADVQLTEVDLNELVQDVILLTPAVERYVTVEPRLGLVWAQRTLLQQCLSNLLDNAAKFVTEGVTPQIRIRAEKRDAMAAPHPAHQTSFNPFPEGRGALPPQPLPAATGWLRLWVEDNGIGIPANAREKIFGIFERVSGLDNVEGTGIGLAIVARAMHQMGGSCGVDSDLGHGSRFWLDLPAVDHPKSLTV